MRRGLFIPSVKTSTRYGNFEVEKPTLEELIALIDSAIEVQERFANIPDEEVDGVFGLKRREATAVRLTILQVIRSAIDGNTEMLKVLGSNK
jgi:hypothetical protein